MPNTETESGKSYTQLEYEFAIENNIPVFALVLDEQYLFNKKAKNNNLKVFEHETENPNIEKYESFKEKVTSKLVKFIREINEIPNEITLALQDFINNDGSEYHFKGWIRGDEVINNKNNKLFELDEQLLSKVIDTLENEYFIETIDNIATNCSFELENTHKIHEFIYEYSKPSNKFFNPKLDKLKKDLIKMLEKYLVHLSIHFFPKNNRQYLYPDLNIDFQWVDEKGRKIYDNQVEKLWEISDETEEAIKDFIHKSRVVLFSNSRLEF